MLQSVNLLHVITCLSYSFYFHEIFAFSDLALGHSKLNKKTRISVSILNGIVITLFFACTLQLPLMISYLFVFSILGINFLLFYKARYLNKLFFISAYIIHFMSLSSIIMASYAYFSDSSLSQVAYSRVPMLHTVILLAVLCGSAIAFVRRVIPAVEIKIINNHNVQLYFMLVWISIFNILLFVNANIFSINEEIPILRFLQIVVPIAILVGLYVVLFFAIQTGKLLGYKAQSEELQAQIVESERKQQELQLKAERDPLTKLYNKEVTALLIEDYIRFHNAQNLGALFLIDLDNFKSANDQRGHIFGDELLVTVAKKLSQLFRLDDIVGRIGGDEFMVFMKNVHDIESVELKAHEICTALHIGFEKKDKTNGFISASIGVALFPTHANEYNNLYKNADEALYSSKDNGKNTYSIYNTLSSFRQLDNVQLFRSSE